MRTFTKNNSFIVKGFAILLLLIYHLFGNEFVVAAMEVDYRPFPLSGFLTFAVFGNLCVSVFVFMTAFGISSSLFSQKELTTENAYTQATRRFFTLMLNFFLLYLSVNLLWWYKFDYAATYGIGKQGLLNMLLDSMGLHNLAGTSTMNVTWWYMKLAYLLIFLVPLLALITKKIGYIVLILSLMFPVLIPIDPDIERYLFTTVLGVCAGYGKWPDKIMNRKVLNIKGTLLLQWLLGVTGFVACVILRQNKFIQENYLYLVDGVVSLFLVYFAGILFAGVPILKNILQFIGKHSLNIYLIHTFFYLLLWQKYIYYFKHAGIILLLLLGISLVYSIMLECMKKWLFKAAKAVWERFIIRFSYKSE